MPEHPRATILGLARKMADQYAVDGFRTQITPQLLHDLRDALQDLDAETPRCRWCEETIDFSTTGFLEIHFKAGGGYIHLKCVNVVAEYAFGKAVADLREEMRENEEITVRQGRRLDRYALTLDRIVEIGDDPHEMARLARVALEDPYGKEHPTAMMRELVTVREHRDRCSNLARFYDSVLDEIANRPTVERNPDGDDQAAATMQLIAREALAAGRSGNVPPPERDSEFPPHLRDDAPRRMCTVCHRITVCVEDFGKTCGMPQPDGEKCRGRMVLKTLREHEADKRRRLAERAREMWREDLTARGIDPEDPYRFVCSPETEAAFKELSARAEDEWGDESPAWFDDAVTELEKALRPHHPVLHDHQQQIEKLVAYLSQRYGIRAAHLASMAAFPSSTFLLDLDRRQRARAEQLHEAFRPLMEWVAERVEELRREWVADPEPEGEDPGIEGRG